MEQSTLKNAAEAIQAEWEIYANYNPQTIPDNISEETILKKLGIKT